jgi:hypothetical protein
MVSVQKNPMREGDSRILGKSLALGLSPLTE